MWGKEGIAREGIAAKHWDRMLPRCGTMQPNLTIKSGRWGLVRGCITWFVAR